MHFVTASEAPGSDDDGGSGAHVRLKPTDPDSASTNAVRHFPQSFPGRGHRLRFGPKHSVLGAGVLNFRSLADAAAPIFGSRK